MLDEAIRLKIDSGLKKEFQKVCDREGIGMSHLLKCCIQQIIELNSWQIRRFINFGIKDYLKYEEKHIDDTLSGKFENTEVAING